MSIGSELYSPSPCSVLSPLGGGEGSETNANRGREFCQGLKKKLDFNPSKNISTAGKSGERERERMERMRRTLRGSMRTSNPLPKGTSFLSLSLHLRLLSQGLKGERLTFPEQTTVLYSSLSISLFFSLSFFLSAQYSREDGGLTSETSLRR